MQSDRELLEKAAKAAGYGVEVVSSREQDGTVSFYMKPDLLWWNPLEDDGDALRLAVKLFLWEAVRDGYQHVDSDNDFYAATRRAIVRAAAAMAPKEPA